jgi:hypothetical protein
VDDAAPKLDLERVRAQQGGAVTRQQALASGLTPAQLRTLLKQEWRTEHRGAYVLQSAWDAGDAADRHALTVASRVAALPDRHVACGRSAALILGLPLLGRRPTSPALLRAPRTRDDVATTPRLRVAALHDAS